MLAKLGQSIVSTLTVAGFLIALAGVGVFLLQCLAWLREGRWHTLALDSIWDMWQLPRPHTGCTGLKRIFDSFMDAVLWLPVWGVIFLIGILVMWFGTYVRDLFGLDPIAPDGAIKET
jgi:hypothetical protein